jgi:glutamate synthase domain-containing protein 1
VGAVFLYEDVRSAVEEHIKKSPFKLVGWREVPVDKSAVGESALKVMPKIFHLLLDCEKVEPSLRELELYLLRRSIETDKKLGNKLYFASLSSKKLVYKGMLVAPQLDVFYPELLDKRLTSWFCLFPPKIFHQHLSQLELGTAL